MDAEIVPKGILKKCVSAGVCECSNEYLGSIEKHTPVLQLNSNYSTAKQAFLRS
jgi:hypothetical protein